MAMNEGFEIDGKFYDVNEIRSLIDVEIENESAIAAVNQIAEVAESRGKALDAIAAQLGIVLTGETEEEIHEAIEELQNSLSASRKMAEQGISSYQSLLKRYKENQEAKDTLLSEIADLKSQHKTDSESLRAIADQLDLDRFDDEQVALKIGELQNLGNSEAKINPLGDLHKRLAIALNLGNVFDDDDVLEAIAVIKKHNLAYTNIIRQTEFALKIKEGSFSYVDGCGFISTLVSFRENILKALNISPSYYVTNDQGSVLDAIANLKHSLQLSQNEVDELQKQDDSLDIRELQSECDYYRGILDKLCDRGNFDSIEALEQFTNAGMYEPRTELRQQLAESQAKTLKYMNRIVELENEVRSLNRSATIFRDTVFAYLNLEFSGDWSKDTGRASGAIDRLNRFNNKITEEIEELRSLKEPLPDGDRLLFENCLKDDLQVRIDKESLPDSDRLSNPELIQIIRSLLK